MKLAPSRRTSIAALTVVAAVLAGVLIVWNDPLRRFVASGDRVQVPDLGDATRIAAGRRVYDAHCAACHGANLEGQPDWKNLRADGRLPAPPHDDTGYTWHHSLDVLFGLVKQGLVPPYAPMNYRSEMPAFGARLTDDEIWNVLAYIRSRWSDKMRANHDELERQIREQRGR